MSDAPINLNKARKARARAEKRARADSNSVTYGLSKAQKKQAKVETSRMSRELDGKAVETPPNGARPPTKMS